MADIIIHTKICIKCNETKPAEAFYRERRHPDGLNKKCIACLKAYLAQLAEKNRERPAPTLKYCAHCQFTKPRSAFGNHKNRIGGVADYCKDCCIELQKVARIKFRDKIASRDKEYMKRPGVRERYREARRRHHHSPQGQTEYRRRLLLSDHGITPEEFEQMYRAQAESCAICGAPEGGNTKRLHVDHDHQTGLVRGLLCSHCNRGLGYFKDSPDALREAADYLEWHRRYPRQRALKAG